MKKKKINKKKIVLLLIIGAMITIGIVWFLTNNSHSNLEIIGGGDAPTDIWVEEMPK